VALPLAGARACRRPQAGGRAAAASARARSRASRVRRHRLRLRPLQRASHLPRSLLSRPAEPIERESSGGRHRPGRWCTFRCPISVQYWAPGVTGQAGRCHEPASERPASGPVTARTANSPGEDHDAAETHWDPTPAAVTDESRLGVRRAEGGRASPVGSRSSLGQPIRHRRDRSAGLLVVVFFTLACCSPAAAEFYPDRPVFDYQKRARDCASVTRPDTRRSRCGAVDPVFNSFVNTPSYGDERAFLDARSRKTQKAELTGTCLTSGSRTSSW